MTDYTETFTKIDGNMIEAADFEIEFQAIATASVTKADKAASAGDITVGGAPVYGLTMLDTQTSLASVTGATDDTWQSYTGSDLSSLNAKIAIIYIYCIQDTKTTIVQVGGEIHVRKNGSSVTNRPVAKILHVGSSASSDIGVGVECMVELDASGHFDFKYDSHSNQDADITVLLNGYYI